MKGAGQLALANYAGSGKMSDLKDKTKEFYDKVADSYLSRNFHRIRIDLLTDFLKLLSNKGVVLDVGCSTGRDVMWLKANGVNEVYGIDFAEHMINLAKEYMPKGHFQVGDVIQGLDFESDFFDGVLCLGTLGNVPKPKSLKVVQEIYRVLKPSGIVVFTVKEGDKEYLEVTNKYGPRYMDLPRRMSLYFESDLNNLLNQAGFKVLKSDTFSDDNYTWVSSFGRK